MANTEISLGRAIEIAKMSTARAKSVKAWRLRRADRNLQQIDMPKGYIFATSSEVRDLLIGAGKRCAMTGGEDKGVWALYASTTDNRGKVTISLMPII